MRTQILLAGLCLTASAFRAFADGPRAAFIPIVPRGDLAGYGYFMHGGFSGDGRIVVGNLRAHAANESIPCRWTLETGLVPLTVLDGALECLVSDISGDGRVIVGTCIMPEDERIAVKWVDGGSAQALPDGAGKSAIAVSTDGLIISGGDSASNAGILWVDGVPIPLAPAAGDDEAHVLGMAADGSRIVGLSYGDSSSPCYWESAHGGDASRVLPLSGEVLHGYASATNADGTVIVGQCRDNAFRWTPLSGLTLLPWVDESEFIAWAADVSGDGSIVLGADFDGTGDRSDTLVWREGIGSTTIDAFLRDEYGLEPRDVRFAAAAGISTDGLSIHGMCNIGDWYGSFIVRLVCPADYNFDRTIDITDALDFIEDFGACSGQPNSCGTLGSPDINSDGEIDILDLLDFFDAFATECAH